MVLDFVIIIFFSIDCLLIMNKKTRQCTLMSSVCTLFLNKKDTHIYLSEIFFQTINAHRNM